MTTTRSTITPAFEDNAETTFPSFFALLATAAAVPAAELREATAAEALFPLRVTNKLETLGSTALALQLKTLTTDAGVVRLIEGNLEAERTR